MAVINMPDIVDEIDGQSVMSVINLGGDMKVRWSADNAHEVASARRTFDELKGQGFTAHVVTGPKGARTTGEVMREFDPAAERVVMVPTMVPG